MSTSTATKPQFHSQLHGQLGNRLQRNRSITPTTGGQADESGLRWHELEWLDPDGTRMGGRVGDRAEVGASWHSGSCTDWVLAAPFRAPMFGI